MVGSVKTRRITMDGKMNPPCWKRPRFLLIASLIVAFPIGSVASLWFLTPAPVIDGAKILGQIVPGFEPSNFRGSLDRLSADYRYWRVKFVPVEGIGQEELYVNVPDRSGWLCELAWHWKWRAMNFFKG
jgi:hypothetical protein